MKPINRYQMNAARRAKLRKGLAPLELALALPILMVMLSLIFGVCTVTTTRMNVTLAARNFTFEKRHTPWKHNAQTLKLDHVQKVSRILGPRPLMPANSGLVSGAAQGAPIGLFGPLRKLALTTNCERFVLGGGWDYQEIEFKKHKQLTLTDKSKYFGLDAVTWTLSRSWGVLAPGSGVMPVVRWAKFSRHCRVHDRT